MTLASFYASSFQKSHFVFQNLVPVQCPCMVTKDLEPPEADLVPANPRLVVAMKILSFQLLENFLSQGLLLLTWAQTFSVGWEATVTKYRGKRHIKYGATVNSGSQHLFHLMTNLSPGLDIWQSIEAITGDAYITVSGFMLHFFCFQHCAIEHPAGNVANIWVSAICVGDVDGVPSCYFWPNPAQATAGFQALSQQGHVSVCLSDKFLNF